MELSVYFAGTSMDLNDEDREIALQKLDEAYERLGENFEKFF